jgi:hypothetical protein
MAVLDLGKTIVQELSLDPSVDTLGRWMAHYVAQLIYDAEQACDETRVEKQRLAFDSIMKLWSHRSTYENRINPLSELAPVIQVLRSLNANENTYIRLLGLGAGHGNTIGEFYDSFRRLMVYLVLGKLPASIDLKASLSRANTTLQFQDEDEREIVRGLTNWLSERELTALSSKPQSTGPQDEPIEEALNAYAQSLLSDAQSTLDKISTQLNSPSTKPAIKKRPSNTRKEKPKADK